MEALQKIIESVWNDRELLKSIEVQQAIRQVIEYQKKRKIISSNCILYFLKIHVYYKCNHLPNGSILGSILK